MTVSLNALRRFLRDSGCIEERVLHDPGSAMIFIEFRCIRKSEESCRAILAADRESPQLADRALARIGRYLAPCLGRSWVTQIPDEDPFA